MNYLKIDPCNCSDYKGWSASIWLSGCSHMCENCFNKVAWKSSAGELFTNEVKEYLFSCVGKPYIDSLVLLGGDPMFRSNVKPVLALSHDFKQRFPDKRLVVFTGYTLEQLQNDPERCDILEVADVLVDGKYVHALRNTNLAYRGSSNQQIYDLTTSPPTNITKHLDTRQTN